MKITTEYLKSLILKEINNTQEYKEEEQRERLPRQMNCPVPEKFGDKYYLMDIKKDQFIHFTTKSRAEEILDSNKLKSESDYTPLGSPVGAFAISSVWGKYFPEVQITHIKPEDIVAILFTTETLPKWGKLSEVFWEDDVEFKTAKQISKGDAETYLNNTETISMPGESKVFYEMPSWCEGFKNEKDE